uniref:Uncharacterized protein n=1 Tax=Mycolicibacterium neoaurum VKM Ac-1815D TaxID=700508 RepID=V5XJM5_MYCNE
MQASVANEKQFATDGTRVTSNVQTPPSSSWALIHN